MDTWAKEQGMDVCHTPNLQENLMIRWIVKNYTETNGWGVNTTGSASLADTAPSRLSYTAGEDNVPVVHIKVGWVIWALGKGCPSMGLLFLKDFDAPGG